MDVGPVELIVLTFPGERAHPEVVAGIADVVSSGYVTVLDVVCLSRNTDGTIELIDVENIADMGLGSLPINAQALIADEDLDVVRDELEPGTSALVIVYEETWARRFSGIVRDNGGEVALHVQLPREAVEAAMADAAASN